jgi:hypothetical protein
VLALSPASSSRNWEHLGSGLYADLIPVIHRNHALNGVSAAVIHGVAHQGDGSIVLLKDEALWASSVVRHSENPYAVNTRSVSISRLLRETNPDIMIVDIEGGERDFFEDLRMPSVRSAIVGFIVPKSDSTGSQVASGRSATPASPTIPTIGWQ